jgi:hypothetical protein
MDTTSPARVLGPWAGSSRSSTGYCMSREAVGTTPAGGPSPEPHIAASVGAPEPVVTGCRAHEVRPQAPQFTAAVDQAWGTIRVRGHLDRVGAEMLYDALVGLQRCGHRHITVQLRPAATVDADARRLLIDLAQQLATGGLELELR